MRHICACNGCNGGTCAECARDRCDVGYDCSDDITIASCKTVRGIVHVTVYKVCKGISMDVDSLWPMTGVGRDFDEAMADARARLGL